VPEVTNAVKPRVRTWLATRRMTSASDGIPLTQIGYERRASRAPRDGGRALQPAVMIGAPMGHDDRQVTHRHLAHVEVAGHCVWREPGTLEVYGNGPRAHCAGQSNWLLSTVSPPCEHAKRYGFWFRSQTRRCRSARVSRTGRRFGRLLPDGWINAPTGVGSLERLKVTNPNWHALAVSRLMHGRRRWLAGSCLLSSGVPMCDSTHSPDGAAVLGDD